MAVCRIHHVWRIRSRLHHRVLRVHARILGCHWITCMWIVRGSQWFSISVIHGLHWVAGHGDLLGCGPKSTECREGKIKPYGCLHAHRHQEKRSHHRMVSSPSAAFSGRGNSRSTWSSRPWSQWSPQTGGWRRQCQLKWWGWEEGERRGLKLQIISFLTLII